MKNDRKATKASDGIDRVASSSDDAIVISPSVGVLLCTSNLGSVVLNAAKLVTDSELTRTI